MLIRPGVEGRIHRKNLDRHPGLWRRHPLKRQEAQWSTTPTRRPGRVTMPAIAPLRASERQRAPDLSAGLTWGPGERPRKQIALDIDAETKDRQCRPGALKPQVIAHEVTPAISVPASLGVQTSSL